MPFVVISVFHCASGRDRTFLHGIFQDFDEAEKVRQDVEADPSYIKEEGYPFHEYDRGISTYVADIPKGIRVNEFIPTYV